MPLRDINKYVRRIVVAAVLSVMTSVLCAAQERLDSRTMSGGYFLQGIVRDSITSEALPRASVRALPSQKAVVADDRGIFGVAMAPTDTAIRVSSVGYTTRVIPVRRNNYNLIVAYLEPSRLELDELVVNRKKYSKRNNPAVDFAKRLRSSASIGDPRRHDFYNYDKYERITLALNDFDVNADNLLMRRFPFLAEYVDTSDVSGKPILNIAVKEKSSTVNYRKHPKAEKTTIKGFKTTGVDKVGNTDNTQVFIEDILREIDLYDNDINLLQNRFVSPLSRIAPDFYKFFLTDTVAIGVDTCAVLSFYPFNRSGFGFTGHVYVVLGDSAMTVRKVEMSVPREINLNFIDKFYLTQTYATAPDGSRLKMTDDLTLEVAPMPGTASMYIRRNTSYGSHSFDAPADMSVFSRLGGEHAVDSVESRTEAFWEEARIVPLTQQESRVETMLDRLGQSKFFYYGVRAISAMIQGYVPVGKKFDYGPLNTTVSFNTIEGTRLRVGGMTTSGLSKRWFARAFGAYGIDDHKWKYRGEIEYSFIDKKRHSREFPVKSLRLTHYYDIDYIGQHYLFTNPDNVFLSLKRMTDRNVIYQRATELKYTLELENNFSVTASAMNVRNYDSPWVPFVNGAGEHIGHYDENIFTVSLRYAPGEKFYQTRSARFPVNLDNPVVQLTQTFAPSGISDYPINKTEFSVMKRFWFSAFGYFDAMVEGAHVWSQSPYINLIIPNANLSYTIQPESFALLNPLEFVNNSQVSWFMTYCPNGLIFNAIPGLKKAGLREAFSFNGFYGHLSDRNKAHLNPSLLQLPPTVKPTLMDHGPYMEFSAGIDNVLRCLRIDYVWRLSYRHPAHHIDRSGLRIALHVTF